MSAERWVDIPGWEGRYQVSSEGRVLSLLGRKPRLMKTPLSGRGYPRVALWRDRKPMTLDVHRLVLLAFVGPGPEGYQACHGDGDRTNARLANLRWDSASENNKDTVRHGHNVLARRTSCVHGHTYTPQNTYFDPRGHRHCRECRRSAVLKHRRK